MGHVPLHDWWYKLDGQSNNRPIVMPAKRLPRARLIAHANFRNNSPCTNRLSCFARTPEYNIQKGLKNINKKKKKRNITGGKQMAYYIHYYPIKYAKVLN